MRFARHEDVIKLLAFTLLLCIALVGAALTLARGERPALLG